MTAEHPAIPVLEISGRAEQIGTGHGEDQRERIHECLDRFLGWICGSAAAPPDEQSLWEKWSPQVPFNEQVAPDLVAEIRGIARGANVPFERIFLLNSMLDLLSFRYTPMAQNFGCTTFAVGGKDERVLIGQTYDMPALLQDFLHVMKIRPEQGPRQLVFTFSGIVGASGLNDAGIGLCINYLSPLDVGVGRLHSVVVRQILAAANLASALEPPVVPPRAGGAHYLVADTQGSFVSVETTGRKYEMFLPDGTAIGHTNHYLGQSLKPVEHIRENSIGSSLSRYAALQRYFRDSGAKLDLESLQRLTQNHSSYPQSICAHGSSHGPANHQSRTLSAMIYELAEGTMHITHGCACENSYHAVSL